MAEQLSREVEGAAWVCEHGVNAHPALLDPRWKPDFVIHAGPPEPEPAQAAAGN